MADNLSQEQRRKAMRSNGGRTKPERALASALWRRGLRYFTHEGYAARFGKRLPGKPDLVFSGRRIVLFVDGCFWHGCPTCPNANRYEMNAAWRTKIERNKARDVEVTASLEADGWRVMRIWEHEVSSRRRLEATADRLTAAIKEVSPPI